jgi:PAS domain S-box-containing protein
MEVSLKEFELLIKQSPVAMALMEGKDLQLKVVNEPALKLMGKTAGEMINKFLTEIFPESTGHLNTVISVFESGIPYEGKEIEVKFVRHGENHTGYYDLTFKPWYSDDGKIKGVMGVCVDVSNNVLDRKKIEERERLYEAIAQNTPDLIYVFDLNYRFTYANEALLKMWGKSWEEAIGKGLLENGYEPWHAEMHEREIDQIIATKQPVRGEVSFPHATLGKRVYDYILVPMIDQNGNVEAIAGTTRDITEIKETQENLKKSEESFRNFSNNIQNLAWIADGEGDIFWYNERWVEYTGLTIEETKGWGWDKVNHPDHLDRVKEDVQKLWQGNEPFEITMPLKRHDGQYRWFLTRGVPLKDENGKVFRWIGTNTDIHDRIEAEEKLNASEKRFALMVQQAPVAMCVLKGEDHIVEIANEKQLELWGISKDQILNQPLFTALPESVGQGFEELLSEVLKTGKPCYVNEYATTLTRNGVHETFYVNFVYNPLINTENKIEGIISVATDVTEQVLARKKAEQSEARYKSLIAAAPMGIGVFMGRDLVIENPNESFIKIVGKGQDVEGKRLIDVMPELVEHGQPYLKILDDVFNTGKMYQSYGDPVIIEREGKTHEGYYDINYIPIFDDKGEVYAILDIAIEVTDKIKAQNKIEESEKRFASLADDSPIFVFIIEPEAEISISYWNKTWLEYTGQSLEEALGKSWSSFIHPDDLAAVFDTFTTSFHNRIPYIIPALRTKHHSGEYRWFSYKGIPRYLPDGTFIGYVGVGFDIHEQILSQKILSEREEKFRSLVQTLPQLVWVTDAKGNEEFTSFRWKEYSGIEPNGEKEWKEIVHPDDFDLINQAWAQSVATGQFYTFDVRLKAKNGEYRWHTVKGEPVIDSDNNIIKWVGAFTDTHSEKLFTKELESKVKERTEELEQFNIELKRKNKELQSFAHISSHDLQEPLRKIQTFASRIIDREYDNLSEFGKDNFKRMEEAAKRMQTLIQDLLLYSKTNSSERKFEHTDLNKIIDEIKEELVEELDEKNVTIETNDLCHANIIPFQFRQLIHNLVSNSMKFSNPDIPPCITINSETAPGSELDNDKLSPQKSYCHISVSDNGIGFEPQYSEKIFDVFQRLHGQEKYKGTGIGLSIVKKIVENHEGIITATGELNEGATFDIYIPA